MNSSLPYKPVLVVVLSRFPFPLEKGDKLRAYFQLRDLSEFFDIELICTTEKKVDAKSKSEVQKFCRTVHIFQLNRFFILLRLASSFLTKKPFQVSYFYQRRIHKKINTILEDVRPDHIYCQLIRTTEYVKNYHNCPKTIDYMDALSKGMERRYENSRGLFSFIFRSESERLYRYERQIFDYFEHHTIISEQDRQYIGHPDRNKIQVIPNGVNEIFFQEFSRDKQYDILFTGNMSYQPNVEAACYLSEVIRPLLPDSIRFLVSGANPSRSVQQLSSRNFTIGGWIEDIRESYAASRIFVAPMMTGTGLQNKLLEAMAMGLPCITTPLANNALKAIHNEHILIADSPEEFRDAVLRLLSDPVLYKNISHNGKLFIEQHYQWKSAGKRLTSILLSGNH